MEQLESLTLVNEESLYSARLNKTGVIPTGYRLLVEVPEKEEKTRGGIYIPQDVKKQEEIASLVAHVLQLGPLAYMDDKKFGEQCEPWCQPGDFIVMAAYSGTRIKVSGYDKELRLINDDSVIARVPSADDVERA